jgi:hypothetical protein
MAEHVRVCPADLDASDVRQAPQAVGRGYDSEFARDCSGSRFPFPVLVLTWLYRDRILK